MKNLFSLKNLYSAYLKCRKNKRHSKVALKFELKSESELLKLEQELKSHTYKPLPSTCFVTESPKKREVFAANFRDRIVHHFLVSYLEPKWEPKFIYDSYACRKKKGIHIAAKRLQSFMRKVGNNGSKPAYFMHLDIKSFFVSINKQILYDILAKNETNKEILWLLDVVIFNDPTKKVIKMRQLSLFDDIPPHKSLFGKNNKKGLPIGNYTSQFFANVYLNELDQFVKHELKCRYYMRYVDDMVLLGSSHNELVNWEKKIKKFIKKKLKLGLNQNQRVIAPITNGCNFLGYIIRPSHILVRKRVVNNCKQKIKHFFPKLIYKKNHLMFFHYDIDMLNKFQSTIASYLGHFSHASSHKLIYSLFNRYKFLNHYFILTKDKKLKQVWKTPRFYNLYSQYKWFYRKFHEDIIFIQIGCFYEFYRNQSLKARNILGLKPGRFRKRLGRSSGFPISQLRKYVQIALENNLNVTIIKQTDYNSGQVRERKIILQIKNFVHTDIKSSYQILNPKCLIM